MDGNTYQNFEARRIWWKHQIDKTKSHLPLGWHLASDLRDIADKIGMRLERIKADKIVSANRVDVATSIQLFDMQTERMRQAAELQADEEWLQPTARPVPDEAPFCDGWCDPEYDYAGSDTTPKHTGGLRDELRDAGYGDFGPM